jgi:CotS family spore coat protein
MPPLKTDQKEWAFMLYLEGRTANYKSREDIQLVTKSLAHFHAAGQHIPYRSARRKPFLFYQRIYRRLAHFSQVLQEAKNINGELGDLLHTYGREFYIDGLQVWCKLKRSLLSYLTIQDHLMGNIAHRDLASHIWIIDTKGEVWLIDWDTAEFDLQLGDLWQLSARILAENEWEDTYLSTIFSAYESVRPLTTLEKDLLRLLFHFPNEFYRESIGLARKKRGYSERTVIPYLKKIISSRRKWREQLKRLGKL